MLSKLHWQTIKFGRREIPLYLVIIESLKRSDYLAKQLAEKLEIEADTKGEAVDFVRQALLDIAEEQYAMARKYRSPSPEKLIRELRSGKGAA